MSGPRGRMKRLKDRMRVIKQKQELDSGLDGSRIRMRASWLISEDTHFLAPDV